MGLKKPLEALRVLQTSRKVQSADSNLMTRFSSAFFFQLHKLFSFGNIERSFSNENQSPTTYTPPAALFHTPLTSVPLSQAQSPSTNAPSTSTYIPSSYVPTPSTYAPTPSTQPPSISTHSARAPSPSIRAPSPSIRAQSPSLRAQSPSLTSPFSDETYRILTGVPEDGSSRAVISALRTLQDKITGLEAEKLGSHEWIASLEGELMSEKRRGELERGRKAETEMQQDIEGRVSDERKQREIEEKYYLEQISK